LILPALFWLATSRPRFASISTLSEAIISMLQDFIVPPPSSTSSTTTSPLHLPPLTATQLLLTVPLLCCMTASPLLLYPSDEDAHDQENGQGDAITALMAKAAASLEVKSQSETVDMYLAPSAKVSRVTTSSHSDSDILWTARDLDCLASPLFALDSLLSLRVLETWQEQLQHPFWLRHQSQQRQQLLTQLQRRRPSRRRRPCLRSAPPESCCKPWSSKWKKSGSDLSAFI